MSTKTSLRLLVFVLLLLLALFTGACETPIVVPPTQEVETARKTLAETPITVEGQISLDQNYELVFDGSGSMTYTTCKGDKENNIAASKWATKEFVTRSLPEDVGLGMFAFDRSGTSERVPIGKNNREAVLRAIDAIRADGGTPLNSSIARGVDVLRTQREKQLGYGRFTLVVVTDGEATDGDKGAATGVAYAERYQIPIVTIGFCLGSTHPLAVHSLSYRSANNPTELLEAFKEVLAESESYSSDASSK